jgi:uncharacterized membrane protein YphA (DoxX/SURF4 family)
MRMGLNLMSAAAMAVGAIPSEVVLSYGAAGLVLAAALVTMLARGEWGKSGGPKGLRGPDKAGTPILDRLVLLGPLFYAMPIAAFGVEHFTEAKGVASIVPGWIPWHMFWVYLLGACFIAAALSLVTGIGARLAASLLALTFFLFVVLMDAPGWIANPRDRISMALMLRELSFCAGPLALAASLSAEKYPRIARGNSLAGLTAARIFIAVTALVYAVEQFLHADCVPAVPLERVTPTWIWGHTMWAYVAAVAYVVTGALLLIGKKTRAAATWLGLTVLVVEIAVYAPIGWAGRASLGDGLNYVMDTLMFCGTVLLLAGALPGKRQASKPAG